jgi:acyl-CoA dehydrogenase
MNHDETDSFVADNFADLKKARLFSAGIPAELGGGDASYQEMCQLLRVLAGYCGSTALALSMHSHLVAAIVWKRGHLQAPVDSLLERIAREQLVLVSSGGSDWLDSSGRAELVDGGFRINARKVFASACPSGDLLMTSAVHDDTVAGPTILQFPINLHSPQVKIIRTWRTLGMRGTGSHDIAIENAYVPASAIQGRRPRGRWNGGMHIVSKVALPLIYSVYVGLAEAARDLALREAAPKRQRCDTQFLAGEMETELFSARLALDRMIEIGSTWKPGIETTNACVMARSIAAQSAIRTVEKAMELVGGRSFYRCMGLERIYRDIQAARFHPMAEKSQEQLTGRVALGLEPDLA